MAVQRYISTGFWDDPWVQTLDKDEKLLYLYFMTNPLTNIAGVYEITHRRVTYDTGFSEQEITKALERFEIDKKAYHFKNIIVLPSWPRHQKWRSKVKIRDGIVSILQELKPEMLEFLEEIGYQFDLTLINSVVISSKMRRSVSGTTQKKIYKKFNNQCAECGADEDLNLHHVIPIKDGGDNSEGNLILLCAVCHQKKHSPDTIYGQEPQSRYQPSYTDTDTDTNTDPNPDRDGDSDSDKMVGGYAQVIHKLSTIKKATQKAKEPDFIDDSIPI